MTSLKKLKKLVEAENIEKYGKTRFEGADMCLLTETIQECSLVPFSVECIKKCPQVEVLNQ